MTCTLLAGATILDPEQPDPRPGSLLIDEGRIVARLAEGEAGPGDATRVDLRGARLAPGFLDLHFHGDLIFQPPEALGAALARCSRARLSEGVTGFLATTVAWESPHLRRVVDALCAIASEPFDEGAMPLGLHLEGPWIRAEALGAQPPSARNPEPSEVQDLLARSRGLLKMVTLAPELPGALLAIEQLRAAGVCIAAGHSLADDADLDAACRAGLTHVTHLFNAMGHMRQREPGLAGLVLADDRLSCDVICDGVHVHASWVRTAARAKRDALCLITDRIAPPDSEVEVAAATGADPEVGPSSWAAGFGSGALTDDGQALRLADGRLAGSSLDLDRALRTAVGMGALSELEAVAACTLRPARVLGIEAQRGTLRPGARADLVVLSDALEVQETWVAGRCRWARRDSHS